MTSTQKTQMEMILKKKIYEKDSIVWEKGAPSDFAILVNKGRFCFYEIADGQMKIFEEDELESGSFAGDINAMTIQGVHSTNLKAIDDAEVYIITKKDMLKFLNKNPGIYMLMKNTLYIP